MICPRLGRALCAALPLVALLVSGCGSTGDDRPNIILIVADDQRFDTLSSAGNASLAAGPILLRASMADICILSTTSGSRLGCNLNGLCE